MMMRAIHSLTLVAALVGQLATAGAAQEHSNGAAAVDYEQFLARHNLIWDRMPTCWFNAPLLGNGMLGTMIYQAGIVPENILTESNYASALRGADAQVMRAGPQSLIFDVGRADVYDHRRGPRDKLGYYNVRLSIGHFTLDTVGKITGFNGKLDLWNAEFTGVVTTEKGTINVRSLVHSRQMVMLHEIEPSEGERGCRFVWQPAGTYSASVLWSQNYFKTRDPATAHPGVEALQKKRLALPGLANPEPVEGRDGAVAWYHQPLQDGGETVTAWQLLAKEAGRQSLYVSVAHSYPEAAAKAEAVAVVRKAIATPPAEFLQNHREWWHEYYPASFVSLPDPYWEGFYWIQMYKLASATRADGALIDLLGPWFSPTTWAAAWFNLNAQLAYWCVGDANRLELGESLAGRLDRNHENLIRNAPEEYQDDGATLGTIQTPDLSLPGAPNGFGNLTWAMHDYWLMLRRSMDERRMKENFFPLLKRSINVGLRLLEEGPDGKLHMKSTFSPEYGNAPDANFSLALLRWGCQTLISICERQKLDDPLLPKWRRSLERLTPYPVDENGFMVGAGMPFAKDHRHYSHLLMIYPLYLVNIDQPGGRELIAKSLRHWMEDLPRGRSGYTLTGAASIAAALGDGDLALKYLEGIRSRTAGGKGSWISGTTMYMDANQPTSETPYSAAQSIHDMLIQSWGDKIRVFPAVPGAWKDVGFRDLRTEGAFLVSAVRKNGRTQWIRVKSLAGEPCRIQTDLAEPVLTGLAADRLNKASPNLYDLKLKKGETAVLASRGAETAVPPAIDPAVGDKPGPAIFGLSSG